MSHSPATEVIGSDGWRGSIDVNYRLPAGQVDKVVIQLEDGQRVLVPVDVLQKRAGGTYYLPLTLADLQGLSSANEQIVLPEVEEQLAVHKRRVQGGGVRVRKVVRQRDELIEEPLLQEDVQVERVAVNRPVDEPFPVRQEGETLIVPLFEEVLVVEKRLMLREELRITRRRTRVRQVQHVNLRRSEATVERLPGAEAEEDRASSA